MYYFLFCFQNFICFISLMISLFSKKILFNPFKIINHILTYICSSILVDKASYVLFIHPPTLSIMEHSPKKENNIACFSNLNFMMASPKFQGDPSFVNWNFVEGMVTLRQVRFVHLWLTHLITMTNIGGQTINCHMSISTSNPFMLACRYLA
jgi:hypothetical protein